MLEEFLAAEDIVRKDPRWQEAMRKRGIEDFDLCMIDPWSTPNVEPGVGPADGRFVSPLTWVRGDAGRQRLRPPGRERAHAGRPGHAHRRQGRGPRRRPDPEEIRQLLRRQDHRSRQHPVSSPTARRTDVKPFDIVQHEGPSFTVEDNHLSWQKWDLRIGFTPREGLVLHQINYAGRSIIYRASLSARCSSPTATPA